MRPQNRNIAGTRLHTCPALVSVPQLEGHKSPLNTTCTSHGTVAHRSLPVVQMPALRLDSWFSLWSRHRNHLKGCPAPVPSLPCGWGPCPGVSDSERAAVVGLDHTEDPWAEPLCLITAPDAPPPPEAFLLFPVGLAAPWGSRPTLA